MPLEEVGKWVARPCIMFLNRLCPAPCKRRRLALVCWNHYCQRRDLQVPQKCFLDLLLVFPCRLSAWKVFPYLPLGRGRIPRFDVVSNGLHLKFVSQRFRCPPGPLGVGLLFAGAVCLFQMQTVPHHRKKCSDSANPSKSGNLGVAISFLDPVGRWQCRPTCQKGRQLCFLEALSGQPSLQEFPL